MEKKSSVRTPSCNARGNYSDSKCKQDNGTKYSRLARFRDNTYSRPEPSRRPIPQRSKLAFDKRPRQRGTSNFDKGRGEVTETVQLGAGSPVAAASKKGNLNHLLNFSFAPRQTSDGHARFKVSKKTPKFSKEQFLQANFQFVVCENGDYSVHLNNPDMLVSWDLVEEIRLPSYEKPSCPICLYPPRAAKITRCGHVYCWPCMMHYLSLSESVWSKCPICYEVLCQQDLKSVVSATIKRNSVGEEITMCLMKRGRDSVYSVPVMHWTENTMWPFNLDDDANTTCFQKLLTSTSEQVMAILDREKNELLSYLMEQQQESSELCFIQMCLELIHQRKEALLSVRQPEAQLSDRLHALHVERSGSWENDSAMTIAAAIQVEETDVKGLAYSPDDVAYNTVCDEDAVFECDIQNNNEDTNNNDQQEYLPSEKVTNVDEKQVNTTSPVHDFPASKTVGKDFYYSYQASDGQLIFLHSLNVRMLIKQYGSLECSPPVFTAKVLQLEHISMTEELRNRLPYLRHLPLTCEFQVVEVEAKPPLITHLVIETFKEEIEKRKRCRTRMAKAEFHREKHIEEEEKKKLGRFPPAQYHLCSLQQFPVFSCDVQEVESFGMLPLVTDNACVPDTSFTDPCGGIISSSTGSAASTSTSFAQMLREGKPKTNKQGQLQSGTSASSPEERSGHEKQCEYTEVNLEDYVPAPEFHQSFLEAIQTALDGVTLTGESTGAKAWDPSKKRKKKILLFSTGINRSK